jgi:molecular chaperone GrpE (heat shock protein)
MSDNEINSLKMDLALIKRDVKQIEVIFQKIDSNVAQMTDVLRTLAVQESILTQNEKKIDRVEEKLISHGEDEEQFRKELSRKLEDMRCFAQKERDRQHREIMDSIEKLRVSFNDKIKEQDKKIEQGIKDTNERMTIIERWKWYVGGALAIISFIAAKISWSSFFGG